MLKKFTNDLLEMSVVSSGGQLIGKLDDFVFDTETGSVKNMLIAPAGQFDFNALQRDPDGRYVVPLKALKSIEDVIMIDTSKA